MSVEARERHARLRLLEEGPKPGLALALRGFGAPPVADVAHQRQELVSPGRDEMDRDLDLDEAPALGDDRGRVSRRRLATRKPSLERLRKVLAVGGRRQLDQRRERGELLARVAGEVHVGVVAGDEAAVLGDDQSLAEVAQRREQRALALDLHAEVALHGPGGEQREHTKADEHERPDHDRADREHQLRHGIDPQDSDADDRDREDVAETTRTEARLEMEEDGGEAHRGKRREVVAQPAAGDAEHEVGEDGRAHHDRELDRQAGGEPREPHPKRDRAEDSPDREEDGLLAEDVCREVGLPETVGEAADDGGHRDAVDEGRRPGPGRPRKPDRGPRRPEQRIGRRRRGGGEVLSQFEVG